MPDTTKNIPKKILKDVLLKKYFKTQKHTPNNINKWLRVTLPCVFYNILWALKYPGTYRCRQQRNQEGAQRCTQAYAYFLK